MAKKKGSKFSKFFSRLFRALFTKNSGHHYSVAKHNNKGENVIASLAARSQGGQGAYQTLDALPVMVSGELPGITGIVNQGNTCYMNAVVQSLSHSTSFAEYITREFCRGGELTVQMSSLIRTLWLGEATAKLARDLAAVVVRKHQDIEFNVQQDAQEFLLWLLDQLHEDMREGARRGVTRARQSFRKIKNLHKNLPVPNLPRSQIERLFGGNYCSTLTCPGCNRGKHTSDPFLCLSLPIPIESTKRPLYPVVYYQSGEVSRIGIAPNMEAPASRFRQLVAQEMGVHQRLLTFTTVNSSGFGRSWGDNDDIGDLPESDELRVFQIPASQQNAKSGTMARWETCIIVLLLRCNNRTFGAPLVMRISRDATARELNHEILSRMKSHLRISNVSSTSPLYELSVVHHDGQSEKIDKKADLPLLSSGFTNSMRNCPTGSPIHVKLTADFDEVSRERLFMPSVLNPVTWRDEPSVRLTELFDKDQAPIKLSDCIQLQLQDEEIASSGGWTCPFCKKKQQKIKKQLKFRVLPDLLILHLKRFKALEGRRAKLNTMIESPLEGLDLHSSVYDLYSVINHQGTLTSGHYVNISKNSLDNSWYQFDDDIIDKVPARDVITECSYVLFYQRRNTKLSPDRHWCLRLPQVQKALDDARLRKLDNDTGGVGGGGDDDEKNYVEEYTDEQDEEYDDDEAPLVQHTYQAETLRRKKAAATLVREAVEEVHTKYVTRTNSTPGLPGEESNYLTMGRGKSTTALMSTGQSHGSSGLNDDRISLDMKAPSAPTTPRMTRDISTKTLPRNSKIMWQKPRSRPQSYAEPGEGGILIGTYANGSKSSSNIQTGTGEAQGTHRENSTQQRRQPSRYRHRTERGRREKRDGSRSRDQGGRSRSRGRSGERRSESRSRDDDRGRSNSRSSRHRPRSSSRHSKGRSQSRGRESHHRDERSRDRGRSRSRPRAEDDTSTSESNKHDRQTSHSDSLGAPIPPGHSRQTSAVSLTHSTLLQHKMSARSTASSFYQNGQQNTTNGYVVAPSASSLGGSFNQANNRHPNSYRSLPPR